MVHVLPIATILVGVFVYFDILLPILDLQFLRQILAACPEWARVALFRFEILLSSLFLQYALIARLMFHEVVQLSLGRGLHAP